jgi:hypothetical protein
MSKVMIRYKVKPESAAENERLVRAVYTELEREAPAGLRYATFRLEDGVSFVHVAENDSEDGRSPLLELEAFREFQQGVAERCAEQPVRTELHEVGSFRFWA